MNTYEQFMLDVTDPITKQIQSFFLEALAQEAGESIALEIDEEIIAGISEEMK